MSMLEDEIQTNPFYKMDDPKNANRVLFDYEKSMVEDELKPGDTARYRGGVLHVNGKPIDEVRGK